MLLPLPSLTQPLRGRWETSTAGDAPVSSSRPLADRLDQPGAGEVPAGRDQLHAALC